MIRYPVTSPANILTVEGDWTNLLSNTQWQINTTVNNCNLQTQGAVGSIAAGTVSAYTTGSNTITFTVSGVPSLAAGQLVLLSGAGIDSNLKISAIRVQSVSGSPVSSFVGQAPYGYAPSLTGNGTIQQISTGDLTGSVTLGPDNWTKTTSLVWALDPFPADIDPGAQRSVMLYKNNTSSAQYFYQSLPSDMVTRLQGQTVTLTWRVKQFQGAVGAAQAFINVNGSITSGAQSVGLNAYEDVRITLAVPTNATTIDVGLVLGGNVSSATAAFYVCKPHLAMAPFLPANYYSQPRHEWVIPYQKITPLTYNAASVTFPSSLDSTGSYYSYSIDLFAETNGAIYPTVPMISAQGEMTSTSVGSPVAFRNQIAAAGINFGLAPIYTQVSGKIDAKSGLWVLANGYGILYTITSGLSVTAFSIDANQYMVSR